jgi:hypothetical protein
VANALGLNRLEFLPINDLGVTGPVPGNFRQVMRQPVVKNPGVFLDLPAVGRCFRKQKAETPVSEKRDLPLSDNSQASDASGSKAMTCK